MKAYATRQREIDNPTEYRKLTRHQQRAIQKWIRSDVAPHVIKSFRGVSSYAIKHRFEDSEGGFYINNGMMKGAMDAAGYSPHDKTVKNWEYALSVKVLNR